MEPAGGGGGTKRKWEGAPLAQWPVDAVVAWLSECDALSGDASALEALLAKVRDNGVDGEVLATLTEADLGARRSRAGLSRRSVRTRRLGSCG